MIIKNYNNCTLGHGKAETTLWERHGGEKHRKDVLEGIAAAGIAVRTAELPETHSK